MVEQSNVSAEHAKRWTAYPSDDLTLPFECESCGGEFSDAIALITVITPREEMRYCTDNCAMEAGWTEAVVRRWELEILGQSMEVLFYS